MHEKTVSLRLIILIFVGLLTSLFFVQLSSRYLFPSRATEAPLSVLFGTIDPKADSNGNASVDVFFSASEGDRIGSAQIALTYEPSELEILPMDGAVGSRLCMTTGMPLTQLTQTFDAKEVGTLVVTRQATQGGFGERLFCWGTLQVKLKSGVTQTTLSFKDDPKAWILSGSSSFYPVFLTSKSVTITR